MISLIQQIISNLVVLEVKLKILINLKFGKIIGVKCKCLVITEGKLVAYPKVLPGGRKFRFCSENACSRIANKTCVNCNVLFCKLCSKVS